MSKISEKDFHAVYPDENALINCSAMFQAKIQERLLEKMYEGKTGWTEEENKNEYKNKLTEDACSDDLNDEKRLFDIAIWAMFLWNMIEEPK